MILQSLILYFNKDNSKLTNMNQFQSIAKVGEGSFACVYKVKRNQDGQIYAMKKIKNITNDAKQMNNCLNEIRILASISNPYILGYKQALYDESSKQLLLITEFAEDGDLSKYIKTHKKNKHKIDQKQIWRMGIQLLHALRALHKMNIFHRDIKSANILLTEGNRCVKLADMNISKISKSGFASTQTGTPFYASPEVWQDLPYNAKCDLWSLGCVLYEMATFHPPFLANDKVILKKKIIEGKYDNISNHYSEELSSFIKLCLTTNPAERLSAEGLLRHSLIRKQMYLLPSELFNQPNFENIINRDNILLQTIKIPNRRNFGNQLSSRLPRRNYENASQLKVSSNAVSSRNSSFQKLPQLNKLKTKEMAQKMPSLPKLRLLMLR